MRGIGFYLAHDLSRGLPIKKGSWFDYLLCFTLCVVFVLPCFLPPNFVPTNVIVVRVFEPSIFSPISQIVEVKHEKHFFCLAIICVFDEQWFS
jgi:hypothetical protein